MVLNQNEFISLIDLGLAFRKAKADMYYSTNTCILDAVIYEENLSKNLRSLYERLSGSDDGWVNNSDLFGDWTLVPQEIDCDLTQEEQRKVSCDREQEGLIHSDPLANWKSICEKLKPAAIFRLMAKPTMDLHVLSALWIAKVGQKYDSKLPECAFGNRVRRKINSEFNTLSIGSFMPYLHPFRKWRDNGFNAMRKALGDDKKIIAITADVKSFYHRLNPDFMLDRHFLDRINLTLSTEEEAFTRLFFRALENWAKSTPLRNGLPVGLPASGIIANMALIELDFIIKKEIVPLYYGRYVDDIILVMENTAGFCAKEEVWDWIIKRSNNLLQWKDSSNSDREAIQFLPDYHKKSTIEFSNKKNKVFMIEGASGVTLIDSLDRQIRERTSEWRALPNLPRNPEAVPTDLLSATQRDGEAADNLRKADSLTLRRAGFAIKLRDFEAYDRDLPPESWEKHRHAFLKAL